MSQHWICIKKRPSTQEQPQPVEEEEGMATTVSSDDLLLTLPHPRTGGSVRYVLQSKGQQLLQVERVQPNGLYSWFVGDRVQRGTEKDEKRRGGHGMKHARTQMEVST